MSRYRQGRKVALNVYDGDVPVFQAHSIESAAELVELLNGSQPEITAAHDVIRRLRTGWEPDIPCIGPEVWCWFHPDTDEPEPLTAAEVAVIEATKETG